MKRVNRGTARWFLKCHVCRKPWAVELPWLRVKEYSGTYLGEHRYSEQDDMTAVSDVSGGPCPLCGAVAAQPYRHGIMGRVHGRSIRLEDMAPVCDGRCTNAKGPSCDCKCRGENHGTQRVIARPVDVGRIPA